MTRITTAGVEALSESEIAAQRERFPRVFSMTMKQKIVRWGALIFTIGFLIHMLDRLGFFSERFYGSLGKLAVMFSADRSGNCRP